MPIVAPSEGGQRIGKQGRQVTADHRKVERRLGRPPRGTEGEVTERILDAAAQLFMSNMFENVSIEDIASTAGMSKRTFYTRFASKSDLFEAFVRRYATQSISPIEAISIEARPAAEILHDIAAAVLQIVLTPGFIMLQRSVVSEAARLPELAQIFHGFGYPRIVSVVERCLERGVLRGEIDVPDVAFAAQSFMAATVRGPLDRATLGLDRAELTHNKRLDLSRAVDLFLRGCLPRSASEPKPEAQPYTPSARTARKPRTRKPPQT